MPQVRLRNVTLLVRHVHLLSDGRQVVVAADFVPQSEDCLLLDECWLKVSLLNWNLAEVALAKDLVEN